MKTLLDSIPHDAAGDELFLCVALMTSFAVGLFVAFAIAATEIAIAEWRDRRANHHFHNHTNHQPPTI
jgi:hypothetical protein